MRSRFDSSRFDSSLVGLQWALRFVLLAIALLALAACGDDPTGSNGGVASVQVTAAAPQVASGDSVLLTAAPKRADGTIRTDVEVSWFSTDTSIARVEGRAGQKAMVVGKQAGTVQIRAMAASKAGETTLLVVITPNAPAPVLTSISPASALEGAGLTDLIIVGENFNELSLIRWNGVAIATQYISATELRGLITPANLAQVGTAEVTVRTGPPGGGTSTGKPFNILSRVATVRVQTPHTTVWVGESVQLSAIPVDANGNDLPARATQWTSMDPDVMTVDANGRVTPTRAGSAVIVGKVETKTDFAVLEAVEAPQYDVMYESNRGGPRELWIVSPGLNETPRRWLAAGFSGEDAATSPNGNHIVFVSRDQYLNGDVWVANRDGSDARPLTMYEGPDDQPTWSPDGSRIAFRSARSGHSDIWVMNANGTNAVNVTQSQQRGLVGAQRPSWGVNGRIYFALVDNNSPTTSQLASVAADGSDARIHTPSGYRDTDPTVSWAGDRIAVRRQNGDDDLGIVILDLNGTPLFYTSYPGPGQMPAWSRNDQFMAYVSAPNMINAVDIYVSRVGYAWRKRITVAEGGARNPVFVKR
jgi:hypothetical protein